MKVKFIPNFLNSQRYSGNGEIEIQNGSVRITGKKVLSVWGRLGLLAGIFLLMLATKVLIGGMGLLLLFCVLSVFIRSKTTETYSMSAIKEPRINNDNVLSFKVHADNSSYKVNARGDAGQVRNFFSQMISEGR